MNTTLSNYVPTYIRSVFTLSFQTVSKDLSRPRLRRQSRYYYGSNASSIGLCSTDCSLLEEFPVCASDLRTYVNKCELDKTTLCQQGKEELKILHRGRCSEGERV